MKFKNIKLRALEPEDLELLYQWENNDSYWLISNTVSPFSMTLPMIPSPTW